MKFDIHCHPALIKDSETYLADRKRQHTDYLIAAGTAPDDWMKTLDLAEKHDFVSPALGLHPWTVSQMTPLQAECAMNQLRQLITDNPVSAISECGLDAAKPQIDLQIKIFQEHLKLAEAFELPVIIHCVKAIHLIEQFLDKPRSNPLILHGFSGSLLLQTTLYRKKIFISPGRNMLRRCPPRLLDEMASFCLAETDDDSQHTSNFDEILARLPASCSENAIKIFSGRMSER